MNYILFDGTVRNQLLPFTYTRPVADIRVGILTIREKWEKFLGFTTTTITEDYLAEKFPMVELEENVMINASFLPNEELVGMIKNLSENQAIICDDEMLAFYTTASQEEVDFDTYELFEVDCEYTRIENTWDIFSKNAHAIQEDFNILTEDRESQPIPEGVQCVNPDNIFIEEGAQVLFSTLNASNGPIYIAKDAQIMEGCSVRGPFALCEHATLKMGAKIYGGTTIGPESKVGGEVNNSVIFGFSNKGHDGFLGNSVIGEWCNLGADTNNSNLKNNYSNIRAWNYNQEDYVETGLQFLGLIMADFSKTGINTMLNTGTVVGVASNVFGGGFPSKFIPSFSWGGASGFTNNKIEKVFEAADRMMERRSCKLSASQRDILTYVDNYEKKIKTL